MHLFEHRNGVRLMHEKEAAEGEVKGGTRHFPELKHIPLNERKLSAAFRPSRHGPTMPLLGVGMLAETEAEGRAK